MHNPLNSEYPILGSELPILELAELPTPVSTRPLALGSHRYSIAIKHDNLTGTRYGGNKVRKLEYLLCRANDRGARRVATFGTVGSNHALATALYAGIVGLDCTCFLSHQSPRPGLDRALKFHQQHGTEIVCYGGNRPQRIATLRNYLHGRDAWVIPLGGSSWLGTVGFVNAGLELAAQIRAGDIPPPSRLYVALGTMGTAAGIAIGLAIAGLQTEVHAIRVAEERYASGKATRKLIEKTLTLMHAYDPTVSTDVDARTNIVCRDEFFAGGYGRSNPATNEAVTLAREELGLALESTYSGKTMAAMLSDLRNGVDEPVLFWNTYNSRPLEVDDALEPDFEVMPREFARYFN